MDTLPTIEFNDNRVPGGRRDGRLYTLMLEARMGVWHPDGAAGIGLPVAAFAELGGAMQNPGPLIRVPQGTQVRVSIRNRLDVPMTVSGLGETHEAEADGVRIEAGESREFRFEARVAGTFYYTGKTGRAPMLARHSEDSQLNGAIVVDPPGWITHANDRVFVISWWYATNRESPTGLRRATMTINGRSWPHTERLDLAQGDTAHWRWINLTILNHPMHLHGFYFRVDGVGNGAAYTTYAPPDRREAVTELLTPGGTMALTWTPTRPGNWIFHCHVATHMSHHVSIGTENGVPEHDGVGAQSHASPTHASPTHASPTHASPTHASPTHAMAGLVLGVRVAPRGHVVETPRAHRALRLMIRSRPNGFGRHPAYGYALGDTPDTLESAPLRTPGPTLVLEQDQPVAITIVNRSHEPAAVHWHGIELESFPDGVPGWSGTDAARLPAIAPGDSIEVRFTPPREGTFMYHSHFNEAQQIASGLYGPIIVVPRGERWDPTTDRLLVFGDDGPTDNIIYGPYPAARLNGQVTPAPLELVAGVRYRLRLINIRADYTMRVALDRDGVPAQWRWLAKDGARLPTRQATIGRAELTFAPGEIHDVEFTPRTAGRYALRYRGMEQPGSDTTDTSVAVHVR